MSAAVFVPNLPEAWGLRAVAQKAILARRLESSLAQLSDMRLIREVEGGQLWRVTARTSVLEGLDYGDFLEQVRGVVEPVVAAHGGQERGVAADFTGAMPLINAIQKTLLHDLFTSFLAACCVIALVTMVVERGIVPGLVAMVPNVFPMVLLFGGLGWARAALDVGSVMTASVALGMAVDGTFHFLTFFRHGLVSVTGGRGPARGPPGRRPGRVSARGGSPPAERAGLRRGHPRLRGQPVCPHAAVRLDALAPRGHGDRWRPARSACPAFDPPGPLVQANPQ